MNDNSDHIEALERDLAAAEEASDEARLETLERVYRDLEAALEQDVDSAGPSRH